MKKLLTLLTVIAVMVVGVTVLAVSVLADDAEPTYTGKLEDAKVLADLALSTPDDAKATAASVKALWSYLRVNKVNPAEEGYDAFVTVAVKAFAAGAVCELNTFDATLPNYYAKIPVSYASQYLAYQFQKVTPAAEDGGEATVETLTAAGVNLADIAFAPTSSASVTVPDNLVTVTDYYNVVKAVMDKKLEKTKQDLYEAAPLDEQPLADSMMLNTFDNREDITLTNADKGAVSYVKYLDEENTDGYYTIDFTNPSPAYTGSGAPYTGTYWNTAKLTKKGIIFQWDQTYFTQASHLTVSTTENSHNVIDPSTGKAKRVGATFITFSGGVIDVGGTKYDCIVPGEWTNIILVIDPATLMQKTYIDYEFVNERYVGPKDDFITVTHIRWGVSTGKTSVSFNNAVLYDGSAPRDVNFLTKMTADEQFAYFGTRLPADMTAEGVHYPSVHYAYSEIKKHIGEYFVESSGGSVAIRSYTGAIVKGEYIGGNAETRKTVESYYAFDPTLLNAKMMEQFTGEYIEKVNALLALERKYGNISARSKAVLEIENYAFTNEAYLDNANPAYAEATMTLEKVKAQVENDSLTLKFVEACELFNVLSSYRKKLEGFERMQNEWNTLGGEAGIDYTMTDPRLATALETYADAPAILEQLLRNENSKTIILYLTPTTEYKTSESWVENYATISKYLKKARPIIMTGMYNEDYKSSAGNLAELISWYETLEDYFYPRLQEEHASYLSVINEEYKASDKYIVKLGAYNRMKAYIAENELTIDETNSSIKKVLGEYNNYEAEIAMLKSEYAALLDDNAKAFVSVVRTLPVTSSYLEIKAAVDSATNYYYNMTSGSDETNAATVTYLAYANYIKLVEESTEQFVMLLSAYNEELTLAQKYTILSTATNLLPYVDTGVTIYVGEGEEKTVCDISKCLAEYDTYAAEYDVIKDSVNSETETLSDIICSLRANCESSGILAYFKQLSK